MSRTSRPPLAAKTLAAAVDAYQRTTVIPHCPECTKPCCRLDVLVLELEWKQIKSFWRIEESRAAFDKRLAAGAGPEEIRAANDLYYAHSKPCPAYDQTQHNCKVYNQDIKPRGCTDFPVYQDEGSVIADLRCEAVDIGALTAAIERSLGHGYRVVPSADKDFPFLVTLAVKKAGAKRK